MANYTTFWPIQNDPKRYDFSGYCNNLQFVNNGASGNVKFSCLLNSYDSGNSLIGTNITIGRDSTSRQYTPAQADTTYAMYVAISGNGNFTGNNVVYEQKQEYALKFKGADYTFSNFVCANAEVSTKKNTVASVAQGTNVDYTKDYIVEDERDNKYYIVRKLYMRANDGTISTACWMTQNLDLDLVIKIHSDDPTQGQTWAYNRENNSILWISSANSDTNASHKASMLNNNMLYAAGGGSNSRWINWTSVYKFETLASDVVVPVFPSSPTSGNVFSNDPKNSNNGPGMIDPGDIMFGPFDSDLSLQYHDVLVNACPSGDTKCYQFRNARYFATEPSGHIVSTSANGNYYNAYSATNSGITYDVSTSVTETASICPKNWDLPRGGKDNSTDSDFGKLMSAYFPTAGITHTDGTVYQIGNNYTGFAGIGILRSGSGSVVLEAPISFVQSYGIFNSGYSDYLGASADYMTASTSSYGSQYMFIARFNSGRLYPNGAHDPFSYGFAMRCAQGISN